MTASTFLSRELCISGRVRHAGHWTLVHWQCRRAHRTIAREHDSRMPAMTRPKRFLPAAVALACLCALAAPFATFAQVPPASAAPAAAAVPSAADLDKLVDASRCIPTTWSRSSCRLDHPLQIVQADRFLAKRKSDPKLRSTKVGRLGQVAAQLSRGRDDDERHLDWTSALGEAVVADQGTCSTPIQAFRRKAQAAGNLKSDTKQTVVVEKEVVTIVPADPQVIYVPQYDPTRWSSPAAPPGAITRTPTRCTTTPTRRAPRWRPGSSGAPRSARSGAAITTARTTAATPTSTSTATPTSIPATSTAATAAAAPAAIAPVPQEIAAAAAEAAPRAAARPPGSRRRRSARDRPAAAPIARARASASATHRRPRERVEPRCGSRSG